MAKEMCVVQLKDRKRNKDFILMMGFKKTIDQLLIDKCSLIWPYV